MLFRNITAIGPRLQTLENICVGIKDGIIAHIGDYKEGFGEEFDGSGFLLAPAFCSAHSHSPMALLRGVGSDLPLDKWLNRCIFPEEARLTPKDIYNGTLAGCAEMLKYGTVSCNDMYFKPMSMAKAYDEAGMKANISLSVTCFDKSRDYTSLSACRENAEVAEYLKGNDNVRLDLSIHAEYTNTVASMAGVIAQAHDLNTGLHIHVSETEKEHDECIARHGMSPTGLLASLGAFDLRTIAAHCVWCTDEDYETMAEYGVYMASCPTSNLKLGSGIPDYKRAAEQKINICLGTDGVASNNNLNMIKEAKLMALLTKGLNRNPSLCTSREAFTAATLTSWRSLGRMSGLIREGFPADLAVYRIDGVNTQKSRDAVDTLIYACDGEAYMTLCNGKVLYKDGEFYTIDKEKLVYEIGC